MTDDTSRTPDPQQVPTPEQPDSNDPLLTNPAPVRLADLDSLPPDGPTLGRFAVLRPHAQGGLGEVLVARDLELRRRVAFKRIKPQWSQDAQARRRFVREAEITGQLEHPGVVPVYGLVEGPDGQPCYAMRFIEGESLRDALHQFHAPEGGSRFDALAFRQLLSRFISVCNTMAFAHSRGIVHRDLKPANVMLGPYGETLVVDWGLARPVRDAAAGPRPDPDDTLPQAPAATAGSATVQGQAVGTPAYMAPEQAEGAWDRVGPAADVFGLGATLYELLTGQRPIQGQDAWEALEHAREGKFPPPRQVLPSVPRPLEAVCLKAMAFRPEDRYATATALAEDLERWLADEPVRAWTEPLPLRARRWLKRHQTLAASAAVLFLAVAAGLAVFAGLLDQTNRQLEAANTQVEQQRQDAVAQGEKARRNLDKAQESIKRMLTQVAEERLQYLPGFDEQRKAILQDALALQRELLDENAAEPRARLETARAYGRIAEINRLLDNQADAVHAGERAVALFRGLAEEFPAVAEYRAGLARAEGDLGLLFWKDPGNAEARALKLFHAALDRWEALTKEAPQVVDYHAQFAMVSYRIALLAKKQGRKEESERFFRRTLDLQRQLVQEHGEETEYQGTLGSIYNSMGAFYLEGERVEDAERCYRQGLALFDKLAAAPTAKFKYLNERAYALMTLGALAAQANRMQEAERLFTTGREFLEPLAQAHPAVPDFQAHLAHVTANLGNLFQASDRADQAEAVYLRSIAAYEKALDLYAAKPREQSSADHYALNYAGLCCNTGHFLRARRRPQEALPLYDKAARALTAMLARSPKHDRAQVFLRNTVQGRGQALLSLGRAADALKDFEQARDLSTGGLRNRLGILRLQALAAAGDASHATAGAQELEPQLAAQPPFAFELANVWARAAAAAGEDADQRERYAARAVELLTRAKGGGYFRAPGVVDQLRSDPSWAALKGRADFRGLVGESAKP